jgi:SEC-C motif
MATDAQISANRNNAQASTGPATADGKSRISRNAVSFGLYSSGDFVRPEERDQYSEFCAGFQTDLAPDGAIEQTLAAEIIHAAWRLRRCSVIEAGMMPVGDEALDPILEKTPDETLDKMQQSVDRARAGAHRVFHRCTAELRRVQTERRRRCETPPTPPEPRESSFTKQSQSGIRIVSRSAPCTCGSGMKFKRCCGRDAPPQLFSAA